MLLPMGSSVAFLEDVWSDDESEEETEEEEDAYEEARFRLDLAMTAAGQILF